MTDDPGHPRHDSSRTALRLRVATAIGRVREWFGQHRALLAALVLTEIAVISALAFAIGPATAHRGTVDWAPSGATSRPLLVVADSPRRLVATFRCPTDATPDSVVLATSDPPGAGDSLVLEIEGGVLRAGPSRRAVVSAPIEAIGSARRCMLVIAGSEWRLVVDGSILSEDQRRGPPVAGLFTDGDVHDLHVTLTPRAFDTTPSGRQRLMTWLTLVSAAAAVGFLIVHRRKARDHADRSRSDERRSRADRKLAFSAIDALVVGSMVLWTVVGPTFYDDGWVLETVTNRARTGFFSSYYGSDGAQLPLGFLHDAILQGFARISTDLLWLRVPALLAGIAIWILIRWGLHQAGLTRSFSARITAGGLLIVFWVAWASTLRAEPMVALLGMVALACAMQFSRDHSVAALFVLIASAALASTLHPAGITTWAALLIVTPEIWRWIRAAPPESVTVLTVIGGTVAAVALIVLLADTDLAHWSINRHAFTRSEHGLGWRDEFSRYQLLLGPTIYGTVARRATAILSVVAIGLFLTRTRRVRDAALDLPIQTLMWALLLLAFTPSKWPWHFGALSGVAALACGCEIGRLGHERIGAPGRTRRSVLALAAIVVAGAVIWRGHQYWGTGTLVRIIYGTRGDGLAGIDLSSITLWAALGLGAVGGGALLVRRRGSRTRSRPDALVTSSSMIGLYGIGALALAVGLSTTALFGIDGLTAHGWSLAKQNLGRVPGGCGLGGEFDIADPLIGADLVVAAPSVEGTPADAALPRATGQRIEGSAPPPRRLTRTAPRQLGDSFTTPANGTGTVVSPWWTLPGGSGGHAPKVSLAVAGAVGAGELPFFVQYGRGSIGGFESLGLERLETVGSPTKWTAVPLPGETVPNGAEVVRVVAVDNQVGKAEFLAFSTPWISEFASLSRRASADGDAILVSPTLRPYFPCARAPSLSNGIAEAPSYLVEDDVPAADGQGPWRRLAWVTDRRRLIVRSPENPGLGRGQIEVSVVGPATSRGSTSGPPN